MFIPQYKRDRGDTCQSLGASTLQGSQPKHELWATATRSVRPFDASIAEAACRVTSYGVLSWLLLHVEGDRPMLIFLGDSGLFPSAPMPLANLSVIIVQRLKDGPTTRVHSCIHCPHHIWWNHRENCVEARV